MIFISVGSMILTVLQIICCWKVFVKAGYEGWKCLIPIYNMVITARIANYRVHARYCYLYHVQV